VAVVVSSCLQNYTGIGSSVANAPYLKMCTKEAFEFSGTHDYTDDYTAVTGNEKKSTEHATLNLRTSAWLVVSGVVA